MKKLLTPTTVIITVAIIVLGYFAYTKFIKPAYLNNSSQSIVISDMNGKDVVIKKLDNQSGIYSLEIEIGPFAPCNYSLIIANENEAVHIVQVKKGKEYIYKNDWYSPTCTLTFKADEQTSHSIELEYRFLGLNRN